MKLDRPALRFAIGFFLVWLCVLYLGADHPPPPGFGWVVVLDLVAALLVYRRVTTYAEWHAARRPRRVVRVLRDGALTGLAFGMLALLFSATRSGGAAALDWEPALVWLVVLTLVGSANTALLYAFISLTGGKGAGEGTKSVGGTSEAVPPPITLCGRDLLKGSGPVKEAVLSSRRMPPMTIQAAFVIVPAR